MADMPPQNSNSADAQNINSTLQNIARQLGLTAQSQVNTFPIATIATSPVVIGYNSLGTTAQTVALATTTRHGLIFHNPTSGQVLLYPSNMTTAPTTSLVGGAVVLHPGGTWELPPSIYPNINVAWMAYVTTTSPTPGLTVIEFF